MENESSKFTVETFYNAPYAVIMYKAKYVDNFSIWIDLNEEKIVGAAWLEFPKNKSRILGPKEFNFIDKSLKRNGDFGVYGNVTQGLRSLVEHYEVKISGFKKSKEYAIAVNLKDGHGHFLRFTIKKTNGKISSPLARHRIAPRRPSDVGIS